MKKVLIVDDAIESRSMIKYMLKNKNTNISISEAENGNEGWKKILLERPDLIFLDLHMPVKTGFEILRDLVGEWMGIPVVVVSEDTSQSSIDSCLMYGAAAYLPKPLNKMEFYNTLKVLE